MMNPAKRKRLEAVGFRVGTVAELLQLTPEQERMVELRVRLANAVRRRREQAGMTQGELAKKIESSQSRVAKIEAGAAGVSLDLLFRGLFAVGGDLADLAGPPTAGEGRGFGFKKEAPSTGRKSLSTGRVKR